VQVGETTEEGADFAPYTSEVVMAKGGQIINELGCVENETFALGATSVEAEALADDDVVLVAVGDERVDVGILDEADTCKLLGGSLVENGGLDLRVRVAGDVDEEVEEGDGSTAVLVVELQVRRVDVLNVLLERWIVRTKNIINKTFCERKVGQQLIIFQQNILEKTKFKREKEKVTQEYSAVRAHHHGAEIRT
jgi:hypothetical protein